MSWVDRLATLGKLLTLLGTVTCFVVLTALYGPGIEGRYMPVLQDMDFTQVARRGDEVEFVVSGRKVRQCTFKSIGALSNVDGVFDREVVSFGTPYGVPNTQGRPMGQQRFGRWFVKPTGDHIKFVSVYQCHLLWDTVTEIGDITLY